MRSDDETLVIARLVVVALEKSELPRSVVEPKTLAKVELRAPESVVEPVTANEVEVAPANVAPPLKATSVEVAPFGNG